MNRGPVYTQLYYEFFEYFEGDVIFCEVCLNVAVDMHHLKARGMGGRNRKDNIKDVMALCRDCHEKYGDKKKYMKSLKKIHYKKIIDFLTKSIF